MGRVTQLLGSDGSDRKDELYDLVAERLRQIAGPIIRRDGQTTQLTGLVDEVFVKLGGLQLNNSDHFFATAVTIVRHALVDRARASKAAMRGGGETPRPIDSADPPAAADPDADAILDLDFALKRLKAKGDAEPDPAAREILARQHDVVTLRFFGGLEWDQIGQRVGVSGKTAQRDWAEARAFLRDCLAGYERVDG